MLVSPNTIVLIAGVHNGSHELGLPNVSPGHRLHGGFYQTNQSFHPLLHCLSLYVCISTPALIPPGCRQPSDRRQRMPLRPLQSPLLRCQGLRLGSLLHKREFIVNPCEGSRRQCVDARDRQQDGESRPGSQVRSLDCCGWGAHGGGETILTKRSDYMLIST